MYIFTKESNGHTLSIQIDKEKLFERLDNELKEFKKLEKADDNEIAEAMYDLPLERIQSDTGDTCSVTEIIECYESIKRTINKIIREDGNFLWTRLKTKQNGTFNRANKPIIRKAINGSYWEDSYGWNTLVLRVVPINDLVAELRLEEIIIHQ